jgi:hypothetical protein
MDTNQSFELNLVLTLKPVYHEGPPLVTVKFNGVDQFHGLLTSTTEFKIDTALPAGEYVLDVEFHNKTDADTVDGKDKAVIIEQISLNTISSQKFVWEGTYKPVYPKLWAKEQASRGIILEPVLRHYTYLGWNGVWTLKFTVPVFSWIHHVENLGWVYP